MFQKEEKVIYNSKGKYKEAIVKGVYTDDDPEEPYYTILVGKSCFKDEFEFNVEKEVQTIDKKLISKDRWYKIYKRIIDDDTWLRFAIFLSL